MKLFTSIEIITVNSQFFLSPVSRTLAKISIMGTGFWEELEKEISVEFIPTLIGGTYARGIAYESFNWDRTYLCGDLKQPGELKQPSVTAVHSTTATACIFQETVDTLSTNKPEPVTSLHIERTIGAPRKVVVASLLCHGIGARISSVVATHTVRAQVEDPSPLALTGWL